MILPIPTIRRGARHIIPLCRLFLAIAVCLMLGTRSATAQNKSITLHVNNINIAEVLTQIEQQSGYRFLYNKNLVDVDKIVTMSVHEGAIEEILNKLFAGTNITYSIDGRQIVLKQTLAEREDIHVPSVCGRITDASGMPIVGAAVLVKGTSRGVTSDTDGRYEIASGANETLVFTCLGYVTAEIAVDSRTRIDIRLEEETQDLEQVVVIGYGTALKKDLTGSVSSIQGDVIADRKVSQLSSALQGSMPGVMVTRNNSAPGSQSSIRIRGITTIGDSSPLVIVDGVPVENINDINPNDVESITVLKDAASASIYGSRAAAGVLLITTKRAHTNELALNYTFEYGVDMPTRMPEYVGVTRFMEMTNELRWNDAGNGSDHYPAYAASMIKNYMHYHRENPDVYPNTNWRDLLMKDSAPKQMHMFSISGGTDRIRTKATFGYDRVEGLYENRSYERFTVRMNNDIKINDFISGAFDVNVKRSYALSPVSDPMPAVYMASPVYAAVWADGRIADGKSGDNAYAALLYGGTTKQNYNQVGGKIALYITPLRGLKLSAIVAPTYNDSKTKKFTKRIEYYAADDPLEFMGTISGHAATRLDEGRSDSHNITTQFFANYDRTFGRHTLSLTAGYEGYTYFNEDLTAARDNYELTQYPYLDRGSEDYQFNSGSAYHRSYQSFFGRVMYNFGNKYLIQANIRCDRSSRFDKDHRTGFFPSVSGGWVLTEEKFFRNFGLRPLTYLKLRASYGTLGNDRVGNYPYLPLLNYTNGLFYNNGQITSEMTAAQWQYAIRDITWETTKTLGLGLDAALFRDRLRLTADYYYKITKDMILNIDIPDYVGYDDPEQNTGKMKTTGFELELGWHDRIGEWSYGVTAHLSDFKSVMGYLGGTQFLGDQVKMLGSYFNEWYGYRSDGLFQSQEEIDNYPVMNSSVRPGDIKYLKKDPNDTTPLSPDKDRVLLGNSQPRYQYGATVSAGWKGIDLNVVIQGVGYQLCRVTPEMVMPLRDNWGNIPRVIDGKYWSHYNTPEQNLKAKYPRLTYAQKDYNYAALSDFWLFDGAYFRLKNITLGYTLPAHITEKVRIRKLRFYVSANDILCFSRFPRGWDPEVGSSSYPITSSVIGGVSVNF